MNPDDNNPIAMTESIVTDDQFVALVSLAANLTDALDDDRIGPTPERYALTERICRKLPVPDHACAFRACVSMRLT